MFVKKTVDTVLASFNKAVTDLAAIEVEQEAIAQKAKVDALEATARGDNATREADRARRVSDRIAALVS